VPANTHGTNLRRLALAFAISLALHAAVVAFLHPARVAAPPQREVVVVTHLITIAHRPKPTPRPIPKTTPTPQPVRRHPAAVIAPAHVAVATPGHAAPPQRAKRRGQAAPRVQTRYHSTPSPVPVVMGGQGAGAGTGAAPRGGVGPGGAGAGTGASGTGSGAAAAEEPCGFVEFVDVGGLNEFDPRTGGYVVRIRMIVHFPDRHAEDVVLDYPWYYPDEASDPWSPQNTENPNFPVTFQWPPAAKAPLEPPLVQFVMQHTTREGYTKLRDCPGNSGASAAPAARPSP